MSKTLSTGLEFHNRCIPIIVKHLTDFLKAKKDVSCKKKVFKWPAEEIKPIVVQYLTEKSWHMPKNYIHTMTDETKCTSFTPKLHSPHYKANCTPHFQCHLCSLTADR